MGQKLCWDRQTKKNLPTEKVETGLKMKMMKRPKFLPK